MGRAEVLEASPRVATGPRRGSGLSLIQGGMEPPSWTPTSLERLTQALDLQPTGFRRYEAAVPEARWAALPAALLVASAVVAAERSLPGTSVGHLSCSFGPPPRAGRPVEVALSEVHQCESRATGRLTFRQGATVHGEATVLLRSRPARSKRPITPPPAPRLAPAAARRLTTSIAEWDLRDDGLLGQLQAVVQDGKSQRPGLCVHFAPVKLTDDGVSGETRADEPGRPGDDPLGIVGAPAIKIASPDPKRAAADLAARSGRPEYKAERSHLNAVGYGVRLDDYAVEYVGSPAVQPTTWSAGSWPSTAVTRASSPPCTVYRVRDLSAARATLTAADVRFTQWGRHSLLLRVESSQSTAGRIELTDED